MRKILVPAFLALVAMAPAGAAFAASTTAAAVSTQAEQSISGTVKQIDLKARSLQLADGSSYVLPAGFNAPANLKAGDKVTVKWKMNGTAHDVTAITLG
ncbi:MULTISPECIES: DUF1344 domain-containing protein [Devosia]|uniref:DUF1344 domain-containing protein n=1 Tax=Devosia equisanguinis TaxID=2490941 RepID=A0A447IB47_9HYPH|nr:MULTISPECIES: DUF1344 domain-containing protein [Devosia]ODU86294.1 MAG: hypothetical protein ABT14_09790 [Pelagibacterium sp. SCN 63-17]VDS04716.1 hypothetical protein DEVEQU_01855 [Devosia equisanguinis]